MSPSPGQICQRGQGLGPVFFQPTGEGPFWAAPRPSKASCQGTFRGFTVAGHDEWREVYSDAELQSAGGDVGNPLGAIARGALAGSLGCSNYLDPVAL